MTCVVAMESTRISHARFRADRRKPVTDRRQKPGISRRSPDNAADFAALHCSQLASHRSVSAWRQKNHIQNNKLPIGFEDCRDLATVRRHPIRYNLLFLLYLLFWHDACVITGIAAPVSGDPEPTNKARLLPVYRTTPPSRVLRNEPLFYPGASRGFFVRYSGASRDSGFPNTTRSRPERLAQ